MSRILIAGDFHGDDWYAIQVIARAAELGCDKIVQIGDYGWWPRLKDYRDYPMNMERALRDTNIHLYWIDGNHEDFFDLHHRPFELDDQGFRMYVVHPNEEMGSFTHTHYIPRGHIWKWDNVTFMGFGGAASIDRNMRIEGRDWFKDEMPSATEINNAIDNAREVEVMLTHDSPMLPPKLNGNGYKEDAVSEYSRKTVAALVDAYRPHVLYHGHYHHRVNYKYNDVRVISLGCNLDGVEDSVIELEL